MKSKIKILLADDEELFRKGLYFLLQRESDMEVIYEASNGQQVLDYLENTDTYPDIILMDLKMPDVNGVEATRMVHKAFPVIKTIALTSYHTRAFIANMLHVGASAYLVKNASPALMVETLRQVFEKGFYYTPEVLEVIQQDIVTQTPRLRFATDDLTNREREVLQLLCQQFNTQEIADKLFISPRTVEGHRNNLLLKTESRNIAGLVVYAIQNKIVTLEGL
ncbi:MAG: response regulator [Flavobacterium sp.]|jgi:DNA-binding NarL/FixJ family response regulator|uniref:response regulator transcription factor n=1 Tax=Flavobacterium sp. TaxID=239 RepID=UPI0022BE2CD1|nr:response regulator transcription factor [Flavobacterium sp.]MCZ8169882.1 response regulator transcription factor [Flavobacterium sp.]MCZ8298087.1 response regulator transcription factor [Flavobacterium sp.]